MDIWKRIGQLNITQLLQLSSVLILRPRSVFPTLKATRQTLKICDSLYGKEHYKNTAANAFRHALWNILICKKVFQVSKEKQKALEWTKKITDLHEKLMPNKPLETLMDLHNNKMGIHFFEEIKYKSEAETISFLKQKASEAVQIKNAEEIENIKSDLIYLKE